MNQNIGQKGEGLELTCDFQHGNQAGAEKLTPAEKPTHTTGVSGLSSQDIPVREPMPASKGLLSRDLMPTT